MIDHIRICIVQDGGPFDDAEDIYVEMTDEEADDTGRKVYIRQIEISEGVEKEHEIFIGSKDALSSLVEMLEFIRWRKGWTKEERR